MCLRYKTIILLLAMAIRGTSKVTEIIWRFTISPSMDDEHNGGAARSPFNIFEIHRDRIADLFQASLCLSSVGCVLGFGAMVTKTWRVYKIAVFRVPKRVVIKNSKLYVIVGIMVCIDAVILSALCYYLAVEPEVYKTMVDANNKNNKTEMFFYRCVTEHMTLLLILLWGYHCSIVFFGIFLAWQTRKIAIEGLNDSKIIGICIYNLGAIFTAFLLYTAFSDQNPVLTLVVRSTFYLYYTTFTLIVIFAPKIKSVFFDNDPSPSTPKSESPANTIDTVYDDTVSDLRDNLNKAESEIKRLKEVNRKAEQGRDPPSGCGVWCFGSMCGCCASPELWKVSTATATKNHANGD